MKKNRMKRLCIALLALVFVGSGAMVLRHLYDQRTAALAYEEAARIASAAFSPETKKSAPSEEDGPIALPVVDLPELPVPRSSGPEETALPKEAQLLLELDLDALRETNEDVLGWICIPDTAISYPLLRSADNREYLTLTWDGKYSSSGSIFLECKNSPDLSDFHTLIYGHNMLNGKMFSSLLSYRDQAYMDAHPFIYVATGDAVLQYQVFSGYTAGVKTDTYRLYFEDDARKQSVIDYYLDSSALKSCLVPTVEDRILTLSTCDESGGSATRFVVHAVLTGEFPR